MRGGEKAQGDKMRGKNIFKRKNRRQKKKKLRIKSKEVSIQVNWIISWQATDPQTFFTEIELIKRPRQWL